jgi:hypothetical protein
MIPEGSIFEANAQDRLVRIFLVGLMIGGSAGIIAGALTAAGRMGNGKLSG